MKAFLLFARAMGAQHVPSLDRIKKLRQTLGAASQVEISGELGNTFYANSIRDIVRQVSNLIELCCVERRHLTSS